MCLVFKVTKPWHLLSTAINTRRVFLSLSSTETDHKLHRLVKYRISSSFSTRILYLFVFSSKNYIFAWCSLRLSWLLDKPDILYHQHWLKEQIYLYLGICHELECTTHLSLFTLLFGAHDVWNQIHWYERTYAESSWLSVKVCINTYAELQVTNQTFEGGFTYNF